jgi:Fic family protein
MVTSTEAPACAGRDKEAVPSSQIEGTQSSLQDLLAAEARLAELPDLVRLIREIHAEPATPNEDK